MTHADDTKLDPAVVAELYVEHADELKRFLQGVLRDSQLAHDVLQATFAKLVEQGHTTQPRSRKAWLFRVAFNEALAFRRRQATGDKAVRQLAWSRSEQEPADELVIRREALHEVRQALKQLTPSQQQVVRMRIFEEKTFAVIARELGIPLGTALGRMRAALRKLKSVLDGEDWQP